MAQDSKPLSTQVRFANGTVVHGLEGTGVLRQRTRDSRRLRSAALPAEIDTTVEFERVLADLDIVEQETLTVEASRLAGQESIRIDPAATAGDERPRVVLYQDESGGLSWHVEQAPSAGARKLRGAGPGIRIPLRAASTRTTLQAGNPSRSLRGPIAVVGRKIFKILILPIASKLISKPVDWFAEKVESRYRSTRIWQVTPDNYRQGPADGATVDWDLLATGPVLLLVHGIFSSLEGMLSGLPKRAMEDWCARYEGRVIAYDHLTATISPEDNARYFLQQIQQRLPARDVSVDIVCHSRGGIVSRCLAERPGSLSQIAPSLKVRSVFFVATPNAGTALGDVGHMIDMIDTFTNCISGLPDGPATYSLEVVVGLVMLLGHSVGTTLPGIAALGSQDSYITKTLNKSGKRVDVLYGAAASNFEPRPGKENGWFIDRLANRTMDKVFTIDGVRIPNDIVVPQQGVFASNGNPLFPIDDPLVYEAQDGVWHTAFFAQPETIAAIDAFWRRMPQPGATLEWVQLERGLPETDRVAPAATQRRTRSLRGGTRRVGGGAEAAPPPVQRAPAARARGARTATLPEETTRRTPSASFPEMVDVGSTHDFEVDLTIPDAAKIDEAIVLAFAAGQEEIALAAFITAPGFDVKPERQARMRILRERNPKLEHCSFKLTAQRLDDGRRTLERTIDVSFWVDNRFVGGVTRSVIVLDPSVPNGRGALSVEAQPRSAPDLTLFVRRQASGVDRFSLDLASNVPGAEYGLREFGVFDLKGDDLSAYVGKRIDPQFADFPDDGSDAEYDAWKARFVDNLKDLGKRLWNILPQPFRNEYLRFAQLDRPPRSICIYSDETLFPWEIVRPSGTIAKKFVEFPPLGVSHVMGRWCQAVDVRPQPQQYPVRSAAILVTSGASGLAQARAEAQALEKLIPGATVTTPVTKQSVRKLLESEGIQLVHFTGHGATGDDADMTSLTLDAGESIAATEFASNRLGAESNPILFLNACTVGRSAQVLGRPGGFAGNCIEAGWSGVVAPYWPVVDGEAADFGRAFYAKMLAGLSIGEALQQLRTELPGDPTSQSYAYFGDPFARLKLA